VPVPPCGCRTRELVAAPRPVLRALVRRPVSVAVGLLAAAWLFAAEPARLDTGTGMLYGTIETPLAKGPRPVVVIIAGSGPTDRDGNSTLIRGHNDSLKMLAEALAVRGVASLRYDKRGIAESREAGLKESDLRFEAYVDDAAAWAEFLRRDKRFGTLIVAGHSEGSLIGMLAARKISAGRYISIAGAGKPAGPLILDQLRSKVSAELFQQAENAVHELEQGRLLPDPPPALTALFRSSVQPYLISWFKYDPAHEIAALTMPVLIVQGSTDVQASVDDAKLLAKANPSAKLVVIDGMNHVMKMVPGDTAKQIASYGDPALPVAPKLVETIATFIGK
jgi:uncharacterized protein